MKLKLLQWITFFNSTLRNNTDETDTNSIEDEASIHLHVD